MDSDDEVLVKTYTITMEPFYDTFDKTYKNILVIDQFPDGHLRKHVRQFQRKNLSTFDVRADNRCFGCSYALTSLNLNCGYQNQNSYMTPEELPGLIAYLRANKYTIDTKITNMLNLGTIKMEFSKILCCITYVGK